MAQRTDRQSLRSRREDGSLLLVQWRKDGSISWENLKDLKASKPVEEVAEYAVANRLVEEPALKR